MAAGADAALGGHSVDVGRELIAQTRAHVGRFGDRLDTTLARLDAADLAWRANAASNSAGNLVLHLCGYLRQRYHAGFGGAPDDRARDGEFAAAGPWMPAALRAQARETWAEVDAFLAALAPERLAESRTIQGRTLTLLELLPDTTAHVAQHVGQIIYIAKLRLGDRFETLSIPRPKP